MQILETLFHERNTALNTRRIYKRSVRYYEQITNHTINELLEIAETEEQENIHWRNSTTRKHLLHYREWLYTKYNISTAKLYLTLITTVYRHFELTIPTLPYYSTQGLNKSQTITYEDYITKDILGECLKISKPLLQALIMFISSSGMSRIDVLNLTIADYLKATNDYHNHPESIRYAISEMQDTDIIPMFRLRRQKTGQEYYTFCSHEATNYINAYLLTRKDTLRKNTRLFKIYGRYVNEVFGKLNDTLNLGKLPNGRNRLTPHMLRKFHATQLAEAGMPTDHINLLQGRKLHGVAHEHYIRFNPEKIREEYIEALPYLVITDVNKYKTQLQEATEENNALKQDLTGILARIEKLEKM